ncbi:DUF305 domain-containing protein [Micromonospora sp. WMMD882]|uniref:DUF305 domain-containing protein n=1 Tax=Micromonospora sp. WMMD882 TaxID=3015151 RepID=UPI00248C0E99|nr:DUF305 domain-containing protein [Micromonospora sp. WMMD882]WBB80864.1 DUF305 domain-containing protein [Micromonospora sp. WMMD882]
MSIRHGRLVAVAAVLLLVTALAVALRTTADPRPPSTAPTTTAAARPDAPAVIVPGRPGEPAETVPGDAVGVDPSPAHNSMDVWFARMMIAHHAQALEMAALAPDRAGDPTVRALADRIRANQTPEVGVLRGWLDARRLPLEETGHDHAAMPGMQSAEAVRRLAAARGAEFDRLFVTMMSDHHRGAVTMATDLLRVGAEPTLSDFATSVAVEQNVEIDRMRALVDR